ncbi:MAG: peptidase M23, partial [Coleofasciculus sp. Co-bin14]|nr:peptidase M23 [Coleofasciculus sp. Co-bin14]
MRGKFFDWLTQQVGWLGVCILCWLLVLTLAFPAQAQPTPTASSTEDLRRMQEQIDQQRSNLIKQRDRLSTIEQATQENISGIQRGIQTTEAAYKDYESQIQKANQHLKALQVELAKSEQAYSQKQASTIARLRFLQRQQMAGLGWYVLLRSQNLNELLDRRHQVKLVYQADQKILNSLKAESERINKQKIEIEGQKNQIALLNQQLLAQKTQYQAQLVAQQELIKRLNTDKQALEAAQAQLAVDSRNIGILIRREIAASNKARFPNTGSFSTG